MIRISFSCNKVIIAAFITTLLISGGSGNPADAGENPNALSVNESYRIGKMKGHLAVGSVIDNWGNSGPVATTYSLSTYRHEYAGKQTMGTAHGLSKKLFVGGGVYGTYYTDTRGDRPTRWTGPFVYSDKTMVGTTFSYRFKTAGLFRVKGTNIHFLGTPHDKPGVPSGRYFLPDGTHVLGSAPDPFQRTGGIQKVSLKNGESIDIGARMGTEYLDIYGFRRVSYDWSNLKGWGVASMTNPIAISAVVIEYRDGRQYQGGFYQGAPQGNGHMQYPDGREEWGYWDGGAGNRELIYKNADNSVYFGRRRNGKRHGLFFELASRYDLDFSLNIDEEKLQSLDDQFARVDEVFRTFNDKGHVSKADALKYAKKAARKISRLDFKGDTKGVVNLKVHTVDVARIDKQLDSYGVKSSHGYRSKSLVRLDKFAQTKNRWPVPSSDILERSSLQVAEYSEGHLVRTFEQAVEACGNLLIKAGHCSNGRPRGQTFAIEPAERAMVTAADYDDDGRAWSYVLNQYDIDGYESSGGFTENKAQGYGQQGNYLGTFSDGKKNGLMWWNGVEKCHYRDDKRQGDCTIHGLVYYQDRFLHRSFFYNAPRIEMTLVGRYVNGLRHGLFTYTNDYLGYTGTLSYDNGVETSRFVLKDAAGEIIEDTQRQGGRRVGPGKCRYAGVLEDCEFENDLRIDAFHVARVEGLIARDKADKIEQKRLADQAVQQEGRRREKARMDAFWAKRAAANQAIRDASDREDASRSRAYWRGVMSATAARYSGGTDSYAPSAASPSCQGDCGAREVERETACEVASFQGYTVGKGNGKHGVAVSQEAPMVENDCRLRARAPDTGPARTGEK